MVATQEAREYIFLVVKHVKKDLSCCQTCDKDLPCCQRRKLDYGRHHIDPFLNVAQVDLIDFRSQELQLLMEEREKDNV